MMAIEKKKKLDMEFTTHPNKMYKYQKDCLDYKHVLEQN